MFLFIWNVANSVMSIFTLSVTDCELQLSYHFGLLLFPGLAVSTWIRVMLNNFILSLVLDITFIP